MPEPNLAPDVLDKLCGALFIQLRERGNLAYKQIDRGRAKLKAGLLTDNRVAKVDWVHIFCCLADKPGVRIKKGAGIHAEYMYIKEIPVDLKQILVATAEQRRQFAVALKLVVNANDTGTDLTARDAIHKAAELVGFILARKQDSGAVMGIARSGADGVVRNGLYIVPKREAPVKVKSLSTQPTERKKPGPKPKAKLAPSMGAPFSITGLRIKPEIVVDEPLVITALPGELLLITAPGLSMKMPEITIKRVAK